MSSNPSITVSAVSPCRRALRGATRSPLRLFGPVLLSAFLRFASNCRNDVIDRSRKSVVAILWEFDRRPAGRHVGVSMRRGTVNAGLVPQPLGNIDRLEIHRDPPGHLVALPMEGAMMGAAQRDH